MGFVDVEFLRVVMNLCGSVAGGPQIQILSRYQLIAAIEDRQTDRHTGVEESMWAKVTHQLTPSNTQHTRNCLIV